MKHGDRFSDQHEQHAEVPHELSVVAGPASGTLIGDDGGIDLAGAVARIVGIEVSGERRIIGGPRSEERCVGKECVSTCRSRWAPYDYKKKLNDHTDEMTYTHSPTQLNILRAD